MFQVLHFDMGGGVLEKALYNLQNNHVDLAFLANLHGKGFAKEPLSV